MAKDELTEAADNNSGNTFEEKKDITDTVQHQTYEGFKQDCDCTGIGADLV